MLHYLYLFLFVLAAICFLLAAFNAKWPKINLVAAGLLLWVLVPLIHAIR